MTLRNTFITDIRDNVLSYIDSQSTYLNYGTGTTPATSSNTGLVNEVVQIPKQESIILGDTHLVSGYLNVSQGNSNTLAELGVLTGSGGTFRRRNVFTQPIAKTSDKELWTDVETVVTVTQS
jgi:hypothetical protein